MTAAEIISSLDLKPLPQEGGYYRETYRSSAKYPAAGKACSTCIYYLLTPDSFSAMHRIPQDELFHFLLGDPVTMLNLSPDGTGKTLRLGQDIGNGQSPQAIVPGSTWQGCSLDPGGKFTLFSVTVAPGFDFSDYENGDRDKLVKAYPSFKELIKKLTR